MTDSCLAAHFNHFLDLTKKEEDVLAELEKDPADYGAGETIFHEGDRLTDLFIVNKGWLACSTMVLDGDRQVLQLHYAGDVMGTAGIAFEQAFASAKTLTPVTLCRFPRKNLDKLFEDHDRLAALLYAIGMMENVVLCDRLKALGRTNAEARVANLILSIVSRMRVMSAEPITEFEMPLTQVDIADAVGVTPVHVNRTLRILENRGLISRIGRTIKLEDEQRLCETAEYTNRFEKIDTSWFPAPS
ncbi:MAG: Crp/Fnr family transcriptional regulator [Sphingopyxis sp.]|nr:MAG: Crp/Fnr family transcriptional regulator [Sphingopyxis sp.]